MKNFWLGCLMGCVLALDLTAQVSNEDLKTMMIVRDLERESRPSRARSVGPKVMGDSYYAAAWSKGSLTLYKEGRTYELSAIKYDVMNFGIDLLIDGNLKSLDGSLVKSFDYKDSLTELPHRFVNGIDYKLDGAAIHGFLEILCWGKLDVYSLTESTLLRPNYNTALAAGNENYQIVKKRSLLYGPGVDLRPLKKKEVKHLWRERDAEMKKFQKINRLSLSNERDLLLMVDYFNTL
ncbi:MAG: hypothetical protein SH819_10525 [Cytophagales bacterium]|nr:hypothetical protein [Cytophagales bacterium]